jgi:hypothetical protein
VPVLAQKTYISVLHQIDQAAGTFAKTHNPTAFDAALAKISFEIPYGNTQLYPTWQADESIYSPSVPGSGVEMVKQLKADLQSYVQTAISTDSIRLR